MTEKDFIFLDTSIFEANNFLEGKRINEMLKLGEEGALKIVIPRLTYDEIINRIKKNIEKAYIKFSKYRDDTRVLRNIPSLKNKFENFDLKIVTNDFIKIIDKRFEKSNIVIIDYPKIEISEIFSSYFSKTFPFSHGKKDEFPDAFALKILENWCKEKGHRIKVFAKDNDITQYKSDYLEIGNNFEEYLDIKLQKIATEKELLIKIKKAIEENKAKIIGDIKNWVYNELDDTSLYYEYSNLFEIHDYDIKETNIELKKYQITSVDDEFIALQFKTHINFIVNLIIDDEDYMYKDDDTKEWVFLETTNKEINENRNINVDIIFYIDENEITDCEVELINNGKKLNV